MNKYDKYKIQPSQESPVNKWDKYKITSSPEETGDSWPALIGKSALKGAGYIADLPNLAAQGLEGLARGQAEAQRRKFELMGYPGSEIETPEIDILSSNIPTSDDARGSVKSKTGIDLEPRPTTGAQRIAMHAAEMASPAGLLGMPGKAASLAKKGLKAAKAARTGAGIGATSGVLQETGVDPLVSDLTASVISPYAATKLNPKNVYSAFQKLPETAAKVGHKIMGLGPKSLNVEAARAARDLGIDLPAAALTNSKLTGLADAYIGKTPYFGDKLGNKYKNAEAQTRDALERIYEEVGPKNTPEVRELINDLYAERIRALPTDAKVLPVGTKTAIDKIGTESFSPSGQEIALMKRRDKIKNKLEPKSSLIAPYEGPARMTAQEALDAGLIGGGRSNNLKMPLQEARVQALIDQKKSLNMDWDEFKGVQEQLKNVHHGIGEDLAAYGKTNPEWYKKMLEADALFASKAKRADLELLLGGSINPSVDQLGYAALSKRIHAPKKLEGIRKQVAPETLAKIEKLGVVARAMAIKNRGVPNPSGTAATASLLGALPSLYVAPGTTIAAVTSTAIATQLLTDKKFIDLALKYAKRPNLVSVVPLNKRIKDVTGYSAVALNRELQRAQEREE